MKSRFYKDLYRYYGVNKESIIQRILRPPEIKYLHLFRRINETCGLLHFYYRLKLRCLSHKTHIQIPYNCKIGDGFKIEHFGRIIINYRVCIGKNVNISTGVIIGQENRGKREGAPAIGNNCWIGPNAVVVGKIKIGNDVLIAPSSYVNFDVPDHSIVIGNPGKIISRINATERYVENTI